MRWWWAASSVALAAARSATPAPAPLSVPKQAVDFGTASAAQCRAPERLPKAIRDRLRFFAMATCDDPELLGHFLSFYEKRGVRFAEPGRAKLVLHPGVNASDPAHRRTDALVRAVFERGHAANVDTERRFSSDVKRSHANAFLRSLPPDALLMSPDLDEFHDAPSSLIAAVAERHGGFVLGHMVDRAAFDWKLRSTRASIPLWTQYPRRCAATAERFHGANAKWILVPAVDGRGRRVRFVSAHHVAAAPPPNGLPASLGFSHYRFGGRSYDLLRRKRDLYQEVVDAQRGAGRNVTEGRAHIYDVVLAAIDAPPPAGYASLDANFRRRVRCGESCAVPGD